MPIVIRSRRDALVWRLVDHVFSGGDAREAVERFELALHREAARVWLEPGLGADQLVRLLHETDPARLGETA